MAITRKWSFIVLSVWLILTGLMSIASVGIPPILMGLLALAAGILLLIDR